MSVKNELIKVLEENRTRPVSGQELATRLQVTRAAIWKAVQTLKKEGYEIDAVQNRGYLLKDTSDVLSEEGIRLFLGEESKGYQIKVVKEIPSTNGEAKRLAGEGAMHGTLVLAESQTNGRGRKGRAFFSPAGTGLYMSVILRPKQSLLEFLPVTAAAAVAVVQVVEALLGEVVQIKWVNDIFYQGKKAGGILTEATMDFESEQIDAVIVGIGLNLTTKEEAFPEELKGQAVSLPPCPVTRNELAAALFEKLLALSENPGCAAVMEAYRSASCVLQKEIWWEEGGQKKWGLATAITDKGELLVQTKEGNVCLRAGEISIRTGKSDQSSF